MLTHKIKEALKLNWGDKARALDCYAEVKFIDPLSSWACYIFAMDESEETMMALNYSNAIGIDVNHFTMQELMNMYNAEGESPIIDEEFRRTHLKELVRRLVNETGRN